MLSRDTLAPTFFQRYNHHAGAGAHDRIEIRDNNWIEAYVRNPDGTWNEEGTVLNYDNVPGVCGHISEWIDWLEKEFIKDTVSICISFSTAAQVG